MKNLAIIIGGFVALSILIYIFKTEDFKGKYEETKIEVNEMTNQKDSLFQLADDVLEVVVHEKELNDSIFSELDEQVKNKEITIEQQVYKLKLLLKEADEANKFAQEQKDIAQEQKELAEEVQKMSIVQKMEAEKARKILEEKYEDLLNENKDLLNELKKYKKLISKNKEFDDIEISSDTLVFDGVDIDLDDINENKKKKKKKKN